jgi:hypothetical protein
VQRRAFEQLGMTKDWKSGEQQRRQEPARGTKQLHEIDLQRFYPVPQREKP